MLNLRRGTFGTPGPTKKAEIWRTAIFKFQGVYIVIDFIFFLSPLIYFLLVCFFSRIKKSYILHLFRGPDGIIYFYLANQNCLIIINLPISLLFPRIQKEVYSTFILMTTDIIYF